MDVKNVLTENSESSIKIEVPFKSLKLAPTLSKQKNVGD